MTCGYRRSDRLCIGGLEFRFQEPISWPEAGNLACYRAFLDRPAVPASGTDIINISLHSGISPIAGQRSVVTDSGDGLAWFTAGHAHIVQKMLPHISSEPLWEIRIHLDHHAADLHFSDTYLKAEVQHGGWPVGAPRYPIDQHLVMHFLSSRQGALVHSAGIAYQGNGFMCSGVSTAGKTTISRLLKEHGGFEILTDDRVILRCDDTGGVMMHGTPWTGEGRYATAGTAPLTAMFFLKKAKDVRSERLSVAEAVARLLPVTSVPWFDQGLMTATLKTLETVATRVPAYDLYFPNSAETPAFMATLFSQQPFSLWACPREDAG